MKILLLQGSARKKGNTATVLGWVADELSSQGHEVTSVYLNNKDLKGCLACTRCKSHTDTIGCVQKDDAFSILEQMVDSQLVVFASPLYFWGVTGPLKTLIDRTYSLYTAYHQPDHDSLVKGQRQAVLITGGGPRENNAQEAFTAFSRLKKPHLSVHVGELFIGGCSTPEALGKDIQQQAIDFAGQITGPLAEKGA